jgi:phosphoribosylanthranilate isomerase
MVKIKICGITNLEDALDAVKLGADALGFVFYKKSPRYICEDKAIQIIYHLPKKIKKAGVFVNEKKENIKKIAEFLKLDMLQFHGNESKDFCRHFKGYKIIKAIRIKNKNSLKDIDKYPVWAVLFDRYQPGIFGGTGKKFNWDLIKDVKLKDKVIFLSGGLNKNNVRTAIRMVKPDWVDASSSLEKSPGKKSYQKMKEFIKEVKNCY